jgi:hypothetical protein
LKAFRNPKLVLRIGLVRLNLKESRDMPCNGKHRVGTKKKMVQKKKKMIVQRKAKTQVQKKAKTYVQKKKK